MSLRQRAQDGGGTPISAEETVDIEIGPDEQLEIIEKGEPDATQKDLASPPSTAPTKSQQHAAHHNNDANHVMDGAYIKRVMPAVGFWLCMSISVILFNKYLYMGPFKHPLSLTAVHMAFASVCTQALRLTGKLQVPSLGWEFYVKHIVPLGVMFALSLSSSNLAAMRLSVSFIQMIKAVTPMMTLAVSVFYGTEKPYRCVSCSGSDLCRCVLV